MKILTVVIPSYNTESFIDKNMSTFLDERLYEKVEILIINDGSKDRTADLAKKYEENYGGYVRVINKVNGGHGSVINLGIKEARGKYFKVIDADDWVNTENLVRLMYDLEKINVDVVINPHMEIDQRTRKEQLHDYRVIQSFPSESPIDIILKSNKLLVLHSVTYKTSILRDNEIRVTEKCFYEDFQYDLYPMPYLKTFTALDYPVYWYLVGQKTQSIDAANALKNVDMAFKVFCDMVDYHEKNRTSFDVLLDNYFQNHISVFLRSIYNIYLRNSQEKDIVNRMMKMDNKIKTFSEQYYFYISKKYRYIALLRTGSKKIFHMLAFAYRMIR